MCDSFVAVGSATIDGSLIFGKNSDRPTAEEQRPIYYPARCHPAGTVAHCTYIEIPEASETLAVLISQPTWMWGAEMGINERGVVIGNEAVWTKAPLGPAALLGMDLVRLGLERGETARQALKVITTLLMAHGQGGPCAERDPDLQYHNSFLIADVDEAWVLETAGSHWAAECVTNGMRNISNRLSIRCDFTLASKGLGDHARKTGWSTGEDPVDFAATFSLEEPGEQLTIRDTREGRGRQLLEVGRGRITPATMMAILRDHDGGICMHGAFRTTASLVCHIGRGVAPRIWMTWGENPCQVHYQEIATPPLPAGSEDWIVGVSKRTL